MSSPASGVAAQAPSSATAHFWGMHAGFLPLQNTQTHLAGDQNAESKMGHIAATIFVAGVAAIVADAAIAIALATGMVSGSCTSAAAAAMATAAKAAAEAAAVATVVEASCSKSGSSITTSSG